jgi:hypothetical protein
MLKSGNEELTRPSSYAQKRGKASRNYELGMMNDENVATQLELSLFHKS